MKQWKFLLSSALAVAGLAMYQTTVFSNTDTIEKITVEAETGDLSSMKDILISGSNPSGNLFSFFNNQLKINTDANVFKRKDLARAQGDPELEKILEKNPDFFRAVNEYSSYIVDKQYALNFYTLYDENTARVHANIYNKKTNKVETIEFHQPNSYYQEILDVYIEGNQAYVAFSVQRQGTDNSSSNSTFIIQKIDLDTKEKQTILEKDFSVFPEPGTYLDENSPFLILRTDSGQMDRYSVTLIDLRTGETLMTEEHTLETSVPYYFRDKENVYRLYVEGSLKDMSVRVEQAKISDSNASFVELSTLEKVPFKLDESNMPVPFIYEEGPSGINQDSLADHLFSTYTSSIIDGKLYMIPNFLESNEKEKLLFYIFDIVSGKVETSAHLNIESKNNNLGFHLMQLKKIPHNN